jgi:hypothetical protein
LDPSTTYCINILFDDVPTKSEERIRKKQRLQEVAPPCKRNLSMKYGRPATFLEPIPALERILDDINRPYA